nr:PHB depolymerase family esterase [Roseobacter litoralis]
MSAGAAIAVILGETYPDVFGAVGAHSDIPAGIAKDLPSAFAAIVGHPLYASRVPDTDEIVRTIVFHGVSDTTVKPSNGSTIAQRAMEGDARQSIETTE